MIDYIAIYKSLIAKNPLPTRIEPIDNILYHNYYNCLWAREMPKTKSWIERCLELCRERWQGNSKIDILVAADYLEDHPVLQKYMDYFLSGQVYITDILSDSIFFLVEKKQDPQIILNLGKFENHMAQLTWLWKTHNLTVNEIKDSYIYDGFLYMNEVPSQIQEHSGGFC